MNQLRLPRLRKLTLNNFTLYSRQPKVEVEFPKPVFCLVGANGLGKSTFLSVINFALTGAVPIPSRPFKSADEYYDLSLEFSETYFDGRISEDDRDAAEVQVKFSSNNRDYELTRGMFEPNELRELAISSNGVPIPELEHLSAVDKQNAYQRELARDIGVESFSQFVFLQHFVFAFDEGRHLLFWDAKPLEQALYLAFGLDVKAAKRADELRREAERADSLARNFNWQATDLRNRVENLESAVALEEKSNTAELATLREAHKRLSNQRDSAETKLTKLRSGLSDAELAIATASAKQVSLRTDYEAEYTKRLRSRVDVSKHPIVVAALTDASCPVCGTVDQNVAQAVRAKLDQRKCPLCEASLPRQSSVGTERLASLDKALMETRRLIEEGLARRGRLNEEMQEAEKSLLAIQKELTDFEEKNAATLKSIFSGEGIGVDTAIGRYKEQIAELLARKKAQYERRDKARKDQRVLQRQLLGQYAEAEETFAPRFRELAHLFLGLDLDIRIETRTTPTISLALEVKSTVRRETYQLSESQRFFVDIALRMALLQYVAAEEAGALLIDTPEGSLDIAYENRAGNMFADFARERFQLILTANINTSRLLLALAEQCGNELMTVCRMTTWTDLSEVQVHEEKLFEEAYAGISGALDSKQIQKRRGKRRG
jgi:energy-coupling factor transporter ATP-binding protein EcfA2